MAWVVGLIAAEDYPRGYYDAHPPLLPGWAAGCLIVGLLIFCAVLALTRND